MAELLVSCQELSKAFGAAPLFEGLSLGVFEGDHVGLVGPNGSGKSTLLKILAGLEEPSSGTRAARKRLRIGYVPQDPVFDPGATVGSVLREALRDRHLDEHEVDGQVAVAMGKAGFADGEQATGVLSGGWKKRLAIARALVGEPELAAPRRAHQPPRRGRHPLARGAAAARAGGLRGGEPRPLLPRGGGGARDRARPRVRPRAPRRARALQPVPGEEGRAAGRAGGLPGVAPQPRAGRARLALAQGPRPHPQGAGAHRRGAAPAGRARGPRLALEVLGRGPRLLGDGAQDEAARGGRGR